jgi:uncharacterized membrane protein HdeD (DUF308 family)
MSAAPQPDRATLLNAERESLRKVWILLLILGIVLILVGLVAMCSLYVTTLAAVAAVGILLLVGGGVEVANAVCACRWRGFWMHLLAGVMYAVLGFLILQHPRASAATFTLMIAAAFFIGGLFRIVIALIERFHGWIWVLINGVVTLVLGILIWQGLANAADWVIGLLVGIELLFAGWSWVLTALAVRTLARPAV